MSDGLVRAIGDIIKYLAGFAVVAAIGWIMFLNGVVQKLTVQIEDIQATQQALHNEINRRSAERDSEINAINVHIPQIGRNTDRIQSLESALTAQSATIVSIQTATTGIATTLTGDVRELKAEIRQILRELQRLEASASTPRLPFPLLSRVQDQVLTDLRHRSVKEAIGNGG